MAKISVIIPVYNVAEYLPKCLESILGQSFYDMEIICVNDCSSDKSLDILKDFAKRDERVKVFSNEKNIGGALSRNVGLDKATGEYIYFMDSDDWLEPDYLEVMLKTIEKAGTDVILNLNIMQETGQGATLYTQPSMKNIDTAGEFLNRWEMIANMPCVLWARLYRRDFLEKYHLRFNPTKNTSEDYIFHCISHIYTDKTFVFMGPAYHYRIHGGSITAQAKSDKVWDVHFIMAYDVIYDYYKEHGFLEHLPIKIFNTMSCFVIDSAEKFEIYHAYLVKVKDFINKNADMYNEIDKYVLKIVTECSSYEEFKSKHIANLTVDFLRKSKQ